MSRHPYQGVPDYQQWYRAVTWAPPGALDPAVNPRFKIGPDDRIATMGSCFAQHVARHLQRSGLHYYVAESAPSGLTDPDARARQYGAFSARYGNVYTAAQAVQLFERAYGDFVPTEDVWERPDGAFADPFRPSIEPAGFSDAESLRRDRAVHLDAVRTVFERSDVLVFTLGLTEAWRANEDGAVFPTAPGVNAGSYDPDRHEFVNFGVDSVRDSLGRFCEAVRAVNPTIKILLTVSPVPLVATYEPRHVLVSTTYSKSVLRVAAADAVERFDFVDYFPSYEIISAASSARNYYRDDLRDVEDVGVAHVMRSFTRHFVRGEDWTPGGNASPPAVVPTGPPEVTCDEETIAAAIAATG